jgi:hypothetical protein
VEVIDPFELIDDEVVEFKEAVEVVDTFECVDDDKLVDTEVPGNEVPAVPEVTDPFPYIDDELPEL